jgi:hypothetical protein
MSYALISLRVRAACVRQWRELKGAPNTAKSPSWSWPVLTTSLLLQASLSSVMPRVWQDDTSPGQAPSESSAMLWSLGEMTLTSYAMSLYVQTFDSQAGRSLGIRSLDQAGLRSWLNRSLDLNPQGAYPLLLASRIYASASGAADAREMLELVHRRFIEAPDRRWPWMAHAVHVARHELHDIELAKRYARSLASFTQDEKVPSWARQLEVFLLEASNETEAARRLLGGLLSSGQIKSDAELRFLAERMKQLPDGGLAGGDKRR